MTHTERKRAWQQHITDWQASGLSGIAYCQQQSLTYCRFVYWRKKLAEPAHGSASAARVCQGGGSSRRGLARGADGFTARRRVGHRPARRQCRVAGRRSEAAAPEVGSLWTVAQRGQDEAHPLWTLCPEGLCDSRATKA